MQLIPRDVDGVTLFKRLFFIPGEDCELSLQDDENLCVWMLVVRRRVVRGLDEMRC